MLLRQYVERRGIYVGYDSKGVNYVDNFREIGNVQI